MKNHDVATWIRAREKERAEREETRKGALKELDAALKLLSAKYHWHEVYILGSLCRPGRFGRDSDVDIGIDGLASNDLYRFVGELSALLDREVDVVRLEEMRLADAIRRKGKAWRRRKR